MYLMSRRSRLATFPECTRGIDASDAFADSAATADSFPASSFSAPGFFIRAEREPLDDPRFFVFVDAFLADFPPRSRMPANPASIASALASQKVSPGETSHRYSWSYDRSYGVPCVM